MNLYCKLLEGATTPKKKRGLLSISEKNVDNLKRRHADFSKESYPGCLQRRLSEVKLLIVAFLVSVYGCACILNFSLVSSLREKCPNTEFFLFRIFPYSDWIRRDTDYPSVFSPNVGKYGLEKSSYLDTFHAVVFFDLLDLHRLADFKKSISLWHFSYNFTTMVLVVIDMTK